MALPNPPTAMTRSGASPTAPPAPNAPAAPVAPAPGTPITVTAPSAPGGGGVPGSSTDNPLNDLSGFSWFSPAPGPAYTASAPAAPQYKVSQPVQNFTNNNFGDFSTPGMQETAGAAHPSILVAPAPVTTTPAAPTGQTTGAVIRPQTQPQLGQTGQNATPFSLDGTRVGNLINQTDPFLDPVSMRALVHKELQAAKAAALSKQYASTPNTALSSSPMTIPATKRITSRFQGYNSGTIYS